MINKENPNNILVNIANILADQHRNIFDKKMHAKEYKELLARLENLYQVKRLIYERLPSGEIGFFFTYECSVMHEYKEYFYHVTNCFCVTDPKIRKKFYDRIKESSIEMKNVLKVKRMVIDIYHEDDLSKKYFIKKGQLTSVVLVGKTKVGINYLEKESIDSKSISLEKMKAEDLPKLVNLDLTSHLADKTSRMREIFMKPDGKRLMNDFYMQILKNKSCIVARKDKKIAGSIGYFINEKNKYGLIASIFVANQYKGLGISKLLYKRLLDEFNKKDLKYYIGSSTTSRVLSLSEKMGRRESASSIIVKI